jgi:hypothetical protein
LTPVRISRLCAPWPRAVPAPRSGRDLSPLTPSGDWWPSCDGRVSIAIGPDRLQGQPRPQCPESGGRPSKSRPSLWARCGLMHRNKQRCRFSPNGHLAFRERAFPRWANQVAAELTSNRSYGRRRLRSAKGTTRCRPWRRGVGAQYASGRGSCARARRMSGERGTR